MVYSGPGHAGLRHGYWRRPHVHPGLFKEISLDLNLNMVSIGTIWGWILWRVSSSAYLEVCWQTVRYKTHLNGRVACWAGFLRSERAFYQLPEYGR